GPSALSDAEAVNITTAPLGLVASVVMSSGTSRSGGVVSPTVTLNEPVAVLPVESLAVHVTGVVPRSNVEPDGGVQVTGTGPSMTSTAVAVHVTTVGPVPGTEMKAGSESVSRALPGTATKNEPKRLNPREFVALH